VSVDLGKKTATVKLKQKASLSKDDVAKALAKTRFKVTSFETMSP